MSITYNNTPSCYGNPLQHYLCFLTRPTCSLVKEEAVTYVLLTEFKVCTVSYGPSFPPAIYGLRASRLGHKSQED